MNQASLFNVSDGKTRKVHAYINNLKLPARYNQDIFNVDKFEALKDKALKQIRPDVALEIIGYNPKTRPGIYDMCVSK